MPHPKIKKLVLDAIRTAEVALNMSVRVCWNGLEILSKLRASLEIPAFHQAIRERDLKEIVLKARQISQVGNTPMQLFHIARRGEPTLTPEGWSALLLQAQRSHPRPPTYLNSSSC